jgi:hypothetical protein
MAVRLDCGLDGLNRFFAVKFRAGIGWSILGQLGFPLHVGNNGYPPGTNRSRWHTRGLVFPRRLCF